MISQASSDCSEASFVTIGEQSSLHHRSSISYRYVPAPTSRVSKRSSKSIHSLTEELILQHDGNDGEKVLSMQGFQEQTLPRPVPKYYDDFVGQEFSVDEWERQEELAAEQRKRGWNWPEVDGPRTYFTDSINANPITVMNEFTTTNVNDDGWEYVDAGDWADINSGKERGADRSNLGIFNEDANSAAEHPLVYQASNHPSPQHQHRHSRTPSYTYSEVHDTPRSRRGLGLRFIDNGEYHTRRERRRDERLEDQ